MQKHTRLQDIDPFRSALRPLTRIILSSACFLVAACGGGGGGTSNNPATVTTSGLNVFAAGGGAVRFLGSDGSQAVAIVEDISLFPAGVDQQNPRTVRELARQIEDIPEVGTTPTAKIYTGALTVNGVIFDVYGIIDNGGDAYIAVIPGLRFLVGGSAYGSAPSGEFTYQGTQGISLRTDTVVSELGTFSLTANFGNKTFSYSGTSTNSAVSGSGSIDTVKGRFATDSLDITAYGSDYTGTMHGSLHGSSSESVSGGFYTNEDNPTYVGGFVGSR